MKITRYKKRKEHKWKKDEYGEVDNFAFAFDFCNGPVCEWCNYSFCKHCKPNGYEDTNCQRPSEYRCQECNEEVGETSHYCEYCGADLTREIIKEEKDEK